MCYFFSFSPKCKTFQKGICNACHIFSYTSYWSDMSWEPWEHRCHCIQTTLITLGFLQPQCLHVTVDYDCPCSLQWDTLHMKIVRHKNSETGHLIPYCSSIELRRKKFLTHQFHSVFCIWTMFWQHFPFWSKCVML